jgi:hypothetical protein
MEIIQQNNFVEQIPPEEIKTFYLYMSEDPKAKYQIYFSYSPADNNKACDYLGTYNMQMKCLQIRGTMSEVLQFRENLEKERKEIYQKFIAELGKQRG